MKYHGQIGVHGQGAIGDVVWVYNKDTVHVPVRETVLTGKQQVVHQ